jgi:hypothetical protein
VNSYISHNYANEMSAHLFFKFYELKTHSHLSRTLVINMNVKRKEG